MYSRIKFLGTVFVVLQLGSYCQGLRCFTCADLEDGVKEPIEGLNLSSSCKWGQKPDDKYLQECQSSIDEDNSQGNIYDFTCSEIKISGKLQAEMGATFIGTIRDCAARLIGTKNKTFAEKPENGTVLQNSKVCKQGLLETVIKNFGEDLIGLERLQQHTSMFDSNNTTVKFCTCKENGCWEKRENVAEATDAGFKVIGMSILSQLVLILSLLTLLN